jgi:hypothetical protein
MQPFNFQIFWRKYNKFILGGLFFLFLVSYCNQQSPKQAVQPEEKEQTVTTESSDTSDLSTLKTYEELVKQRSAQETDGPGSFLTMFLLLMGAFILVWLLQKPKMQQLLHRWFPGRVMLQVVKGRDSVSGRRVLKISIFNKSAEGITFLPPYLVFRRWGKERKFRLKGSNQEDMFPLTLTPGTSHRLVLDLDQFYEKLPDLKNSNRVGASVETTGQKEYRSFALPGWLSWIVK